MKLNYKEYGEGEPLIVIHGLLGMLDNWSTHARKWSKNYRVITVDARNHGRSLHSEEMSYEVMKEDLKDLMDQLEINEAHLLGHSMGGKIVMKFAQNYPYRVKKLIVADISPCEYPVRHDSILEALNSVELKKLEKRTDADEYLKKYISEAGIRQFLMKSLYQKKDKSFAWRFNLAVLTNHIADMGESVLDARFEGKTLFIRGTKSDYITDDHKKEIDLIFPHSSIADIEGAGHWLHAEKPDEFYQLVTGFLAE